MAKTALNRSVVVLLTNKSGGAVAQGDVVVMSTGTAAAFTTTTTSGYVNGPVGVILEPNGIANDAIGLVAFGGYVPKINLSGAASLGDLVKTHSVAKQGVRHAAPAVAGDFAIVLGTGTGPAAMLFGIEFGIGTGGSGGYTEGARVYNNANISCGGSAVTTATFNSEVYDTDTIHDTVSNTERLTCKTAGKYTVSFAGVWASALPAGSGSWIEHDTRGRLAQIDLAGMASGNIVVPPIDLAINDYLVVKVYVASGGAINLIYGSPNEYSPFFAMQRIG